MVRVISQETYDDLVKENIEEFEMSPEEATSEAIAQLEAQEVDLSNIIKDLAITSSKEHFVTSIVSKLKELWTEDKLSDDIAAQLKVLKKECEKDIAYKLKASKDGAYDILLEIIEYCIQNKQDNTAILALETMTALMDMQPDLLEQKGVGIIKSILDDNTNDDIIVATLQWSSACCLKHERNRQKIFATKIVNNMKKILKDQDNLKLISELLLLMRRLCADDDIRVEFGEAHETARELAIYTLDTLIKLLKEHREPPLVSEIMQTLATVLVRHEFCQAVADGGGADCLPALLRDNYTSPPTILQAFKLIIALAGNDDVKRLLIRSGIAPLTVLVINHNMQHPIIVGLGLKCISALCLREPTHSLEFVQNGAPDIIADAMNRYPDNCIVQKHACWAIRNIVARSKDQNAKFLELGVEQLLNSAYSKFQKDFGFDIKSALRDLECDVTLHEQWTGKGVQMQNSNE